MTATKLYWVDGPWYGRLALSARPRGGDWLEDEMASWEQAGLKTVFSLLTREEERDLDLVGEASHARAHGLKFLSFPIPDRQVPDSEAGFTRALDQLNSELASGNNVVLHRRQGVGRTGLVAACLLLTKELDAETAVSRLSAARGVPIPETQEQRQWIDRYAATFANAR